MSRWNWLKHRAQRLESGTLTDLVQDISYCRQREALASRKDHIKTWRKRRAEAEASVLERFGEQALEEHFGGSHA